MNSMFLYIVVAVISLTGGWFWGSKTQRKRFTLEEEKLRDDHKDKLEVIYQEQAAISDQFFQANVQKLDDQRTMFNDAFLSNGRSVEAISVELKTAQASVTDAFSDLPKIYGSIDSMQQTTVSSKEKINELSHSVDAWQGSIQTLQGIQDLIDGIHEKSIQIRDVSGEANLLALNASIEAARAGEHGRGFAVVAECMRDLSNKSAAATVEINTSVEMTRTEVTSIIKGIEESVSLLTSVTDAVASQFSYIESEVVKINEISEKSCHDASESEEKYREINGKINTQLESITKLLADTMGVVTGNKVEDIPINSDLSDMKIIDVRRPDEFNDELGHIDGAELMCLQDNFEFKVRQLDKETNYVFVCRSGGRSARAARVAVAHGFQHVYNLEGGMLAWRKAGRDNQSMSANA